MRRHPILQGWFFTVVMGLLIFGLQRIGEPPRPKAGPAPEVSYALRLEAAERELAVVQCFLGSRVWNRQGTLFGLDGEHLGTVPVERGWASWLVPPGSGAGEVRFAEGVVAVRWTEVAGEGRCDDFGTVWRD
ncbi:MAG: hypothetical protein JXX28_15865 [Deltaproteobacteria bacterium]|nr:hypothetical protein [Deltaproteobacteria bacterium]